jgi:hypothetical protein
MKIASATMTTKKIDHIIHELEFVLFELTNQKVNTLLGLTLRVKDLLHYVQHIKTMEDQNIER